MSLALGVLLQISVSVQMADTIPARTAVPLVIRATAPGNTAPRLTVPTISGGEILLQADVTRLGGGFGQAVATRETRYILRATRIGSLTLSPIVATLGTQQAISPVKTVVVQPPPTNAVPAIVTRAPLSRNTPVNFHALVTPDTVWAGEQVTLQVGVFIDDDLRSRLQRNPEYVAPQVDGAVAYELPVANDLLPSRTVEGARYRPFVFARALFPLRAGTLAVPAARLAYTLGSATMFGRAERQTSTTAPLSVVVRELPVAGRPSTFSGAVGVFSMTALVERPTGRVGDAIQLTVKVEGVGNVKLLPAPIIDIPNVTSSPSGETIAVDTTDLLVRGSKTFRFLLTPRRDGELPLGSVRYAYFNPVRGEYSEVSAPLGSLRVAPGTAVSEPLEDAEATPQVPLQPWTVESTTDITERWWFRAVFLALGLPWLALVLRRIWRAIPRAESRERRKSGRVAGPREIGDPASVRRTFVHGLAPIVGLRADEPFAVADVVRRLRRAGATNELSEAAGVLLMRLDLVTFGRPEGPDDALLQTLATESDDVLAQLSKELSTAVRSRLRPAGRVAIVLCVASATLHAQPAAFVTGGQAYAQQRYGDAVAAFAAAAAAEPHSAAAWANLGAAQWMRADTAGAILAWQRSARLVPRGNSAAERLREFAPSSDIRAAIVPVSPDAAWLLLLGVTVVLSVAGAAWRWSHRRISNAALFGATLLVGACAGLSVLAQRSAAAENLVLVRREVALRTEPVLAGEAGARARAGEIAVLQESRGTTWRLLVLPGGRTGWVEVDAIRSLALADGHDVALAEARIASDSTAP